MRKTALLSALAVALVLTLGCGDQAASGGGEPAASARPVAFSQEADSTTRGLFDDAMEYARTRNLHERPIGEVMTILGERFLEKPYEGGMLDAPQKETLICRLDAFDCVTFVESTLAMARGIKQQDYTYKTWTSNIRDQRYRGGSMDGYCSRLHYFTEWIRDNEARGTVKDITAEIGGVPLEKNLDFMSTHRSSYPRFAENDSLFQCIKNMEGSLRGADLHYIPQDRIESVYDELRAGDVLAFATNVGGLDVTHTGLVYDSGNGQKGVLHASSSGGEVQVSPDLQSYVQGVDSQIGIIVARPLEPAKS